MTVIKIILGIIVVVIIVAGLYLTGDSSYPPSNTGEE